jgi:hypothetical protein
MEGGERGRAANRGRERFESLVDFVVENSRGGLNHKAHKGHERGWGKAKATTGILAPLPG